MLGRSNNPVADLPDSQLDRALSFRTGVVAACEGRDQLDDGVYQTLRREFMQDALVRHLVPQFVRSAPDTASLWAFLKGQSGQWEPRRQFVRQEFARLVEHLESGGAPADDLITETLDTNDAEGVALAWRRALNRRLVDPEGAITAARTLLESVCKHILEDEHGIASYSEKDDLPKLYRLASERLNIAPSQHSEDAFKRILGSAASVVEGLGSLRNKVGDAHAASGRKPVRVAPRHAALAVNLAGSMASFLIETAAARKAE